MFSNGISNSKGTVLCLRTAFELTFQYSVKLPVCDRLAAQCIAISYFYKLRIRRCDFCASHVNIIDYDRRCLHARIIKG